MDWGKLFAAGAALASIFGGVSGLRSSRKEADALREQADIQRADDALNIDTIKKENKARRAKIVMAYIKSGVSMKNSPLLFTAEQKGEDEKKEKALGAKSFALHRLGYKKADIQDNRGRSALIGSAGQTLFNLARLY
ncbi:MAG: hypothetical protein GY928_04925 [Colwellia sp.]|nr:hypothetical protein [Colwellia sp.]